MVRGFSKMYIFFLYFLDIFFTLSLDFAKKIKFLQICTFFADSKSRAYELSNDVSVVIFGHQTWDLEGGGVKLIPHPQRILVFKQGYRVNQRSKLSADLLINSTFIFYPVGKL